MRALPPLSALKAFEATARTGSVTRAAEELHRTHGAVSRQLRVLQEHAGVKLFEKEGTGLTLSEHGQALYAVVQPVFDSLELGYRRVLQQARRPGLHVACSATFAMRWLVPHLADFYRLRPDIHIHLSMMLAQEMRADGADLFIAWDLAAYAQEDRARAITLAPMIIAPVCSPSYQPGKQGSVRISHEFIPRAWDQWKGVAGHEPRWAREITFPHSHLCIEAAIAGLGVALVAQRVIRKELEENLLVAPYGYTQMPGALMAVPAAGRVLSTDAEIFASWLRAEFSREDDSLATRQKR